MNETSVTQVLTGDCLEATFPRHYPAKDFMRDASRLRGFLRKQSREPLTEDEQAIAREFADAAAAN